MRKNKTTKIIIIAIIVGLLLSIIPITAIIVVKKNLKYEDPMEKIYYQDYDGELDYDKDGIPNDKEKEFGTEIYSPDTDKDGLNDYYEIEESKTDPLVADTDKDGLTDFIEIKAGLNPLEKKTDGKTLDKKREFEATEKKETSELYLKGSAEIYDTYFETFSVSGLDKTPGVLSQIYEVFNKNGFEKGKITFVYNDEDLKANNVEEKNISLFTFESDGSFKKVRNVVLDTENNTVSTDLKNSGKYLMGDEKIISAEHGIKIMLLIDNSGSMFPKELCEDSEENDVNFKRLDMAKSIVESIDGDVEYGLAKFTGTYTELAKIGTEKNTLLNKIEGIRNIEEDFNGTYIATSIISSLSNFSDNDNSRKFIVILTDGGSTEHSGLLGLLSDNPDEKDAIEKCNEKNVSVITIGLGNSIETDYLQTIANQTGGAYIYANNDDALEKVYEKIKKQIVYSAEDTDADGKADAYVVADSGFVMEKDAFSFENFITVMPTGNHSGGFCYGMAFLAQEFYRNDVKYSGRGFDTEYRSKDYEVTGFDISECLEGVKNLREYENEIMNKYDAIYEVPKKERYEYKDKTLYIKDEILEKYSDEYITTEVVELEKEDQGVWGLRKYEKMEKAFIDIKKYTESNEKNADMEMICALYWRWATQIEEPIGVNVKTYELLNNLGTKSNEEDYNIIVDKISSGIPMIVSFNCEAGGHAINAMRILRDIEDPNLYFLECYDNNDEENPYYFRIEQTNIGIYNKLSISNWDMNFSVAPYILEDDEWKPVTLEFLEIET